MVDEDIKAQNLEAHVIRVVIGLAGFIMMAKYWLNCRKSLDEEGMHILPEFVNVVTLRLA